MQVKTLEEKEIGKVAVDSGEILISDPCHLLNPELGIKITGFGGDGNYKVYIHRNEKGIVEKAIIDFVAEVEPEKVEE